MEMSRMEYVRNGVKIQVLTLISVQNDLQWYTWWPTNVLKIQWIIWYISNIWKCTIISCTQPMYNQRFFPNRKNVLSLRQIVISNITRSSGNDMLKGAKVNDAECLHRRYSLCMAYCHGCDQWRHCMGACGGIRPHKNLNCPPYCPHKNISELIFFKFLFEYF